MRVIDAVSMRRLLTILVGAVISVHSGTSADSFASLSAASSGETSTGGQTPAPINMWNRRVLPESSFNERALESPKAEQSVAGAIRQVPRILAELAELQMQHRYQADMLAAMESTTIAATPASSAYMADLSSSDQPMVSQPAAKQAATFSLRDCMTSGKAAKPFRVQDFIEGKAAALTPELELHSAKPAAIGVTVLTISTLGRISRLEGLCDSWGGPISVAVYVGLSPVAPPKPEATDPDGLADEEEEYDEGDLVEADRLRSAVQVVQNIFDRIDKKSGGCQLSITLLSELLASENEQVLFPYNALRNAAHLGATTPLVLNVDADMVLSSSLTTSLSDPVRYANFNVAVKYQQLLDSAEDRKFIIIPAFESDTLAGVHAAIHSKAALLEALDSHKVKRFADHFPPGHAATNYSRWGATDPGAELIFDTKYTKGFEGWGIVSRRLAPMWDVKYRGYGKDKIAWTSHLDRSGFRFTVSVDWFMVHRPHKSSPGRASFISGLNRGSAEEQNLARSLSISNKLLGETNAKHMGADNWAHGQNKYITLVGNMASCRDALPHWRIFGSAGGMPVN